MFIMFIGLWGMKKIRFLGKNWKIEKCQIYKEEKSGI